MRDTSYGKHKSIPLVMFATVNSWKINRIKLLLLVVLFLLVVLIVRVSRHVYTELRCAREAINTPPIRTFSVSSKSDAVEQLVNAYGFELSGGDHGDGHLLPERMATCRRLTPDADRSKLGAALHWLATARVEKAYVDPNLLTAPNHKTGHSMKLLLTLEGNRKAMFKIKRHEIDEMSSDLKTLTLSNDRHNSEIAAFHLQRLLGFNGGPLVVGRKFDFQGEILPVSDDLIQKSLYRNGSEICMHFTIADLGKTVCFESKLEGAVVLWLPRPVARASFKNPSSYCRVHNHLRSDQLFFPIDDDTSKLMDAVEILLIDYLLQNLDRHLYFYEPTMYSSLFMLDNGNSFSELGYEADQLLREFAVRCQIRDSTYERLKLLSNGVLGTALSQILSRDPIAPVLWDPFYDALDKRLEKVLHVIDTCLQKHGASHVLVPDSLKQLHMQSTYDVYMSAILNTFQTVLMGEALDDFIYNDVLHSFYILIGISFIVVLFVKYGLHSACSNVVCDSLRSISALCKIYSR